MDNRGGLIIFFIFVLLGVFSFIFGWQALAVANDTSLLFGILALLGFLVCIFGSLMNGLFIHRDGGALAPWYLTFTVVAAIVFIWFGTRCGTAFGWWT